MRLQTNPHLVNEAKTPLVRIKSYLTYCQGQKLGAGGAEPKRKAEHKSKAGRQKVHVIVRYKARKRKGAVSGNAVSYTHLRAHETDS